MAELYNILGEMSESERHILMRSALRAKHLRFLDHQGNVQKEQRYDQSTAEQRAPLPPLPPVEPPAKEIAIQPTVPEPPMAQFKMLPDLDIASSDNVDGVGGTRDVDHVAVSSARSDRSEQLANEIANLLDLRRMLDSGKLTQTEYLRRLNWS